MDEKAKKSANRHDVAVGHCVRHHDLGCQRAGVSIHVFDQCCFDLHYRLPHEEAVLPEQKDSLLQQIRTGVGRCRQLRAGEVRHARGGRRGAAFVFDDVLQRGILPVDHDFLV